LVCALLGARLGTNPINQLSKKWGLNVVPNDGTDVVFYDNHVKVNGTKAYNDFNDALDATYDLARTFFNFRYPIALNLNSN
jgi:hypothetical protein